MAACSVGKWPRALTARRSRALIDSIALVVQMTVRISPGRTGEERHELRPRVTSQSRMIAG